VDESLWLIPQTMQPAYCVRLTPTDSDGPVPAIPPGCVGIYTSAGSARWYSGHNSANDQRKVAVERLDA
jgi:hypothetical protein